MNKEEYEMVSRLLQYTKALKLLVEWSEQCGFGLDNIRDDEIVDWDKWEKLTEDMGYMEGMIYYANMYLHESDEPIVRRIRDADVDEFIF